MNLIRFAGSWRYSKDVLIFNMWFYPKNIKLRLSYPGREWDMSTILIKCNQNEMDQLNHLNTKIQKLNKRIKCVVILIFNNRVDSNVQFGNDNKWMKRKTISYDHCIVWERNHPMWVQSFKAFNQSKWYQFLTVNIR